jgi:hypothetical protein
VPSATRYRNKPGAQQYQQGVGDHDITSVGRGRIPTHVVEQYEAAITGR